jgi:hypothetical protein
LARARIPARAAAAALAAAWLLSCDNPLLDADEKTRIRILVDSALEGGDYIVYWDGKDKDSKTVAPGAYRCVLRAVEFEHEITLTALEGTKGRPADSTGTGTGFWFLRRDALHSLLEQNFPEPFYAKDGTNIPFTVPPGVHVLLSIHRKE